MTIYTAPIWRADSFVFIEALDCFFMKRAGRDYYGCDHRGETSAGYYPRTLEITQTPAEKLLRKIFGIPRRKNSVLKKKVHKDMLARWIRLQPKRNRYDGD